MSLWLSSDPVKRWKKSVESEALSENEDSDSDVEGDTAKHEDYD